MGTFVADQETSKEEEEKDKLEGMAEVFTQELDKDHIKQLGPTLSSRPLAFSSWRKFVS